MFIIRGFRSYLSVALFLMHSVMYWSIISCDLVNPKINHAPLVEWLTIEEYRNPWPKIVGGASTQYSVDHLHSLGKMMTQTMGILGYPWACLFLHLGTHIHTCYCTTRPFWRQHSPLLGSSLGHKRRQKTGLTYCLITCLWGYQHVPINIY